MNARETWQNLLQEMDSTVVSYHPAVHRLPCKPEDLIDGTAFFPGGSGLWRGLAAHGSLPQSWPRNGLMFVGHNFDSVRAFERSRRRGGEATGSFWQRLLTILDLAGIDPATCFFTNALMGLQPGSSTGPMPSTPAYIAQCDCFLRRQIQICSPRAILALGKPALLRLQAIVPLQPTLALRHPSGLTYVRSGDRSAWLEEEADKLRHLLLDL